MGDNEKSIGSKIGNLALYAVMAIVVLGIPVGLIIGGFQERVVTTPVPGGITTTGEVTDVRIDQVSGRGGGSEYAEIEFTDREGKSHSFEATSVSNAPDIGTKVKVSYDPNNPDHAADLSIGNARWITFVTIGSVLLVIEIGGGALLTRAIRRSNAAKAAAPAQ